MLKKITFFYCFFCMPLCAVATSSDDCLEYKTKPDITITTKEWTKQIIQPEEDLPAAHGQTEITSVYRNSLSVETIPLNEGFCIILKSVNTEFGYDFLVKIDKHHLRGSCTYDAVIEHENLHINAYINVMDNFKKDIKPAMQNAANSVMPVFVKDIKDVSDVFIRFGEQLKSYPEIVQLNQKMIAQREIEDKKIDTGKNGKTLQKCINKN